MAAAPPAGRRSQPDSPGRLGNDHTDTPPKVVLDEAIELAKKFSTEQSPAFVNGVLDAVLREHQSVIKEAGECMRHGVHEA